ncbi:hypothetical protein [Hoeflea sp.]|uniref:hypothetical protein n=1 Tax=Hoeflea sp. TaxID=1940281 RepID=UPI003A91154A
MDWIFVILALSILAVIVGGLLNRHFVKKGIGWQFIRFNVIAIGLPIAGLLALNSALTGEAATLIAGAMGYAFAKTGETE